MGLETSPPYLSLINGATLPITGVSFASGGSGILNETGQKYVQYIPLARQVDYYCLVHDKLVQQMGPSTAKMHLLKSIFAIFIGSNDLQDYFSANSSISNVYTPQQYIERLLSTYKSLLKTLYGLGARKILVAGSAAVGCYPVQRKTTKTGECNVKTNYWCSKYNDGLKIMLQRVKSELFGLSFAYFDLYGAMDMFRQDDKYGFTNIRDACCGLGKLKADAPCIPTSNCCSNRKNHVYWDFIHPTEAVASIIADIIYNGTHECMVPMNLKRLVDI
ncbi:GDSL esterase/lipase At5g55050-like [Rutidosis leptorrhynchoides]|uniref:GDSL esterase/lipase At5g55050-like n=1 Tax=Rutidosis leptorrhynchoides TaxID=125765 RepID=UPI003A9A2DFA